MTPLKATFLTYIFAKRMQPVPHHTFASLVPVTQKHKKIPQEYLGYLGLLPRPALVHPAQGQTSAALLTGSISHTEDISGALLGHFQQLQANISVIPLPTSSAECTWSLHRGCDGPGSPARGAGDAERSLHPSCASLPKPPQRGQGDTADPARPLGGDAGGRPSGHHCQSIRE